MNLPLVEEIAGFMGSAVSSDTGWLGTGLTPMGVCLMSPEIGEDDAGLRCIGIW